LINNTTSTTSSGSGNGEPGTYDINISAIGDDGIVTSGTLITLTITGGVNGVGNEFIVTDTDGFLQTSYEFIGGASYSIDVGIQQDGPIQ
jgi:hypothetical protein